ncbi:HD domain-containing phosphohydrolase [Tissierella praeacuta]|uniref:HD domain-containing phosphohydrolase n=1 Tax=Tissierella praeacuta TaxID=43131 RepID=UPI0033428184
MNDIGTCISKNGPWKVLIVDDDNFIHRMLKEVNKNLVFEDKGIMFYSAYTSSEAIEILKENEDVALVLVDVFLEDRDTGLNFVKYIREDVKDFDIRLVLMTGKGSNILQDKIILNYDINGYENKSDLFSKKMKTVILSSLRSFRDIIRIKNHRESMEKVVSYISKLYEKDTINDFLISSLYYLSSLINQCKGLGSENCPINSFVGVKQDKTHTFTIIGGTGKYRNLIDNKVEENISDNDFIKVSKINKGGDHELFDDCYIARYKSTAGNEAIIFIERYENIDCIDIELLNVFHKSISATFDNLCLNLEIEETQKEILYTLGEVTEARSEETGSHVKRVSKYCQLLAEKYGLSQREIMLIANASPIHDIGKVAIPDKILLKPGKLTKEEFNIIKTHTTIGYNLLKNSKREILKAAAIVAHEHHERYDGGGYPRGLKGEEIHIYGRISAIADVFDALGSPRVYKKAWIINDILNYFKDQSGKHFDPKLVDILFNNLDEFMEIKEKYSDENTKVIGHVSDNKE